MDRNKEQIEGQREEQIEEPYIKSGRPGLELSSAAGITLQQTDDGGVALRSLDELLQGQLA